MISVALATYNSTKYIAEQLDSIRKQSVPVDEVVIVDDCSSDKTVNLIENYIKKFNLKSWRIHRHEKNKGFIQTFTDALIATSGDVVILCDHDDVWLSDKIKIIKSTFDEYADCLALASSFIQIDAEGKEVQIKLKKNHANNNLIRRSIYYGHLNKMSLEDVAVYNISPGCTCAVRRSLIDAFTSINKKIEQRSLPHDWKLNIIAAAKDGLYYLDVPTTKYRIYSNNTIGLGHQSNFEKRKVAVDKNCDEKHEAAQIVAELKGEKSNICLYYKDLEEIFQKRSAFMEKGNYFDAIKIMLSSIGYRGLYESIALDMVARIKRYV